MKQREPVTKTDSKSVSVLHETKGWRRFCNQRTNGAIERGLRKYDLLFQRVGVWVTP